MASAPSVTPPRTAPSAPGYPGSVDPSTVTGTTWQVRHFLLAMAGGLAGIVIVGTPVVWAGASTEAWVVAGSIGQFAGHLVVVGILARARGGARSLGFSVEPADSLFLFGGLGLQVAVALLFALVGSLIGDIDAGQSVADELRSLHSIAGRVAMAAVVAVMAPVAEEVMFRGILLRALAARGRSFATVVSAIVFAGFHVVGISGNRITGAVLLLPTFVVIGIILARMTWRRGRLGPAIFVHSGFNLLAVLVLLIPIELLESATRT
jgi:membrane protease YdiL (CAAX protease family)